MPTVSVVIVTWNSLDYLPRCFGCLSRQHGAEIEVIVVDNGSTDGSVEWLRTAPEVSRIIENDGNLGFCVANNQGIRAAHGDYVLLLNTDVFLDEGCIATLLADLESDPTLGAAGGKLLRPIEGGATATDATIDSAGEAIFTTLRMVNRGEREPDRGQYDDREEIFGLTAAAVLYRRAMLDDVSIDGDVFDSDFFAYLEDSDLNWRARLLGWRFLYDPAAVGLHVRQHATGRSRTIQRHALANRYLSMAKNAGWRDLARWLPHLAIYELFRLVKLLARQPRMLLAYGKVFRKMPAALRKRRVIQARRRVGADWLRDWAVAENYAGQVLYRCGLAAKPPDADAAATTRRRASLRRETVEV